MCRAGIPNRQLNLTKLAPTGIALLLGLSRVRDMQIVEPNNPLAWPWPFSIHRCPSTPLGPTRLRITAENCLISAVALLITSRHRQLFVVIP